MPGTYASSKNLPVCTASSSLFEVLGDKRFLVKGSMIYGDIAELSQIVTHLNGPLLAQDARSCCQNGRPLTTLWRRCHRAAASTGSGQELEYEKCANCDGGGHGGSSVSRCGKVECRRVAEVQQQ
ncbi:MAG: hypothetical protein E5V18_05260 [Mesorhizobium sp.]|nr:MAG: hypothetical protein E5V18_05260 [Mesorhizobium sp.]